MALRRNYFHPSDELEEESLLHEALEDFNFRTEVIPEDELEDMARLDLLDGLKSWLNFGASATGGVATFQVSYLE